MEETREGKNYPFHNMEGFQNGDFWLDCTAGAFRDFNAAAHLLKYSPNTKIIMIVRDPWQVHTTTTPNKLLLAVTMNIFRPSVDSGVWWLPATMWVTLHYSIFGSPSTLIASQNLGSRLSMQLRRGHTTKKKTQLLIQEFKKYQYEPPQRFTSKTIAELAGGELGRGTDYAYAEKLLTWNAAFPSLSSLLVLDQFDLQVSVC